MLKKIYQPRDSPANVAVFMSGSGTNAVNLIEAQQKLERNGGSPFKISLIVTDNGNVGNNSWKIAEKFGLSYPIYLDFKKFMRLNRELGAPLDRTPYYDAILGNSGFLEKKIDFIALAGYELIVTEPLLSTFADRVLNVHPADLSLRRVDGKPVYTGNKAVLDAILAGEQVIRSSTHIVVAGVDEGSVLMVSEPVKVTLPDGMSLAKLKRADHAEIAKGVAKQHQNILKGVGDWRIYPLTLEWMARGLFERDEKGVLHLVSMPIPNGFKFDHTRPVPIDVASLRR